MSAHVAIHPGDNRLTLRRMIDEGVRVHSVCTDPPYGLTSITKRFGKNGAAPAKHGTDGAFKRASGGFMGKAWDGTGIERDPDFWRLIWEILLPGGCVFAFSGSRTGHWQACAMETAGFIMHPMHGWVFGSGCPKAHDASKAIDKMLGCDQIKGDIDPARAGRLVNQTADYTTEAGWSAGNRRIHKMHAATHEAAQWDGWAYGTQTQKPALENIYLGQKPHDIIDIFALLVHDGLAAILESEPCLSGERAGELLNSASAAEVITTLRRRGLIDQSIAQSLVRLLPVPESADPTGAAEDMSALTDTLLCELMANTSWSTAKSWRTALAVLWSLGSTYTTAITSETITDLKTWNSLTGLSTPGSTIQLTELTGDGSNAAIAGRCLKRACARLLSQLGTIATEIAFERHAQQGTDPVAAGNRATLQSIYLGQRPFSEKTGAANLLKHGVGAFNIAATRVGLTPDQRPSNVDKWENDQRHSSANASTAELASKYGTPEIRGCSVPETANPQLLGMEGIDHADIHKKDIGCSDGMKADACGSNLNTAESGKPPTDQSQADLISTTSTATSQTTGSKTYGACQDSTTAKSTECTEAEKKSLPPDEIKPEPSAPLGRWPSNLLHDGSPEVVALFPQSDSPRASGNPNNPRNGTLHRASSYDLGNGAETHDYRDSGSAARFFNSFEPDADPVFYQPKAGKADRAGGKHPTVKPIALMRHLIRHITPPGGTVLDPFAGSGTTGEAARQEGFDCILMEAEPEYVEFLQQRFAKPMTQARAAAVRPVEVKDSRQPDLFEQPLRAAE